MFSIFQQICWDANLNWKKYLIGQSYDGASNMRGEFQGLQALIVKEIPSAAYIWCYAHRLYLIVMKGYKCSENVIDTFGNLESLYSFVSSSKKRISYYEEAQK